MIYAIVLLDKGSLSTHTKSVKCMRIRQPLETGITGTMVKCETCKQSKDKFVFSSKFEYNKGSCDVCNDEMKEYKRRMFHEKYAPAKVPCDICDKLICAKFMEQHHQTKACISRRNDNK